MHERTAAVSVAPAGSTEMDAARALMVEYATEVGDGFCFEGFDEELAALPGAYAPPSGRLLLVHTRQGLAGCVALRALAADVCEVKRLYLRPAVRGGGLGRRLVETILAEARAIGYARIRLDTLPSMAAAYSLYRALGFVEIAPYWNNPIAGVKYMELELR